MGYTLLAVSDLKYIRTNFQGWGGDFTVTVGGGSTGLKLNARGYNKHRGGRLTQGARTYYQGVLRLRAS